MTLDRLIKQLQVIREQTGRGDLQVIFRDPANGFPFDEIMPYATEVFEDEVSVMSVFDLAVGDYYVEM